MSAEFVPHLEVLPAAQQEVWQELEAIPAHFVLYGGTAIALQLGGRQSVDFDFFTSRSLDAHELQSGPLLGSAQLVQSAPNTATFIVQRGDPVRLSFFGGLTFGRVGEPRRPTGRELLVASLLDLGAQKVRVVQVRAELKDYLDLDLLLRHGFTLSQLLGAARALYPGFAFGPTLKALCYFEDGDLRALAPEVRKRLEVASAECRSILSVPRLADDLLPIAGC